MLGDYLAEKIGGKIGIIVNYFSKQFLSCLYDVYPIPLHNYVDYLMLNDLDCVILDNDLYENDHAWYDKNLNGLIAYLKLNDIKIIVIQNTENRIENNFLDFYKIFLNNNNDSPLKDNEIKLPLWVDENSFNPINSDKKIDILYINTKKINRPKSVQIFHKNLNPVREELILQDLASTSIKGLIEKSKVAKCLYIYEAELIDSTILKYLEIIATLQHTIVLYPSENLTSELAIVDEEVNLINKMIILIKDALIRNRTLIPIQRYVFLNHTFVNMNYNENLCIGTASPSSHRIPISVISSTNRKQNLQQYIVNLNRQNHVHLQVTLVTHGFILDEIEKKEIYDTLKENIDLKIIEMPPEVSLGECLNEAIKNVRYDYTAKMDDDDYYFENYLIDSWIASKYSRADLVGKLETFSYLKNVNIVIRKYKGKGLHYNSFVMGATFFAKSKLVKKYMFSKLSKGEDSDFLNRIKQDNASIYVGHPFNFCIYRSGDLKEHTWQISDIEYMRNSEIYSHDLPDDILSF